MKTKRAIIHYLPIYGCISTGLIYIAIGVIAMLSFLKLRDGGADESSMLAVMNDFTIGKVFIWIILSGTLSYIVWRIYEAVTDPYGYGTKWNGLAKRVGIGLSTIADLLIVYAAIRVLLGISDIQVNGQPKEEREMVTALLQEPWGMAIILSIGCTILVTAIVQFIYGVTRGYKERVNMEFFSAVVKSIIHVLAWIGYFSRGIILGITGFFFIKAGISENAKYVVNTDKAFDFIGDHVGHVYFIAVAIGTICYGVFMLMLGVTYKEKR